MPPSSPKDPCSSCHKNVNKNHRAILCDICDQWIHLKCNLLNRNDYKKLQNDPSPFFCLPCSSTIFPFGCVTNNEFYSLITKGISFPDPNDDSTLSRPLSPQIQNHISNLNLYLEIFFILLTKGMMIASPQSTATTFLPRNLIKPNSNPTPPSPLFI